MLEFRRFKASGKESTELGPGRSTATWSAAPRASRFRHSQHGFLPAAPRKPNSPARAASSAQTAVKRSLTHLASFSPRFKTPPSFRSGIHARSRCGARVASPLLAAWATLVLSTAMVSQESGCWVSKPKFNSVM